MAIATVRQTVSPDRGTVRTIAPALTTRYARYTVLATGTLLAVAAAAMIGDPAGYLARDADLGRLLRGMALIKGLFVLIGMSALAWRFRSPISTPLTLGYCASVWVSAGASMLIWQLSAIGAAAAMFHGGEIALLLLAWRDWRQPRSTASGDRLLVG